MKVFLFIVCSGLILVSNQILAQEPEEPRSYIAYKANAPIVIDGDGKEKDWSGAPWSADFIDIEGKKVPKFETRVKMLWDEYYLYVYAEMEEPHIWGTLKQRDTIIFYNNDFEIFIDPDGDTHNYMELEINTLNTLWDLFLTKPYRESGLVLDNWDLHGLKSAIQFKGTLNDPTDIDKRWSLEVALPWSGLKEATRSNNVPSGEYWRINFSRVNWDFQLVNNSYERKQMQNGNYYPEYNWVWSPQGVINMHEPEHWGYVFFSEKNVGQKDQFKIPREERIRWLLYEIYKKQKEFLRLNNNWATSLKELKTAPFKVDGMTVYPELELHATGWNISIKSPFSGQIHIIKEDGQYLKPQIY